MAAAKTVWFSFRLGRHRPAVSLSAFIVSPLTQTIVLMWMCGWIGPLFQFPYPLRAGPILPTLLLPSLVPSSHQVLHGSIYSFPLIIYSCPLSAGILHALPCMKVYSWCIHGKKCIPHPLNPLPSCPPVVCLHTSLSYVSFLICWNVWLVHWHQSHSPHSCHYWKELHSLTLVPLRKSQRDLLVRRSDAYPSANSMASEVWIILKKRHGCWGF